MIQPKSNKIIRFKSNGNEQYGTYSFHLAPKLNVCWAKHLQTISDFCVFQTNHTNNYIEIDKSPDNENNYTMQRNYTGSIINPTDN